MAANPFGEATLGTMMDAVAARHGAREAIVFGDERITFAGLNARAKALARGLAALGLRPGDTVALWLPNRPAWFYAQHACARLGAVVVALNPRYKAHELAYILAQSDARALILTDHLAHTDYFETLHEILPELQTAVPGEIRTEKLPLLRHVIVDAEDPYPGCWRLADLFDAGCGSAREGSGPGVGSVATSAFGAEEPAPGPDPRATSEVGAEEVAPTPNPPAPAPDDVFAILYTSGTTSFPKGAMITHRNAVPHAWHCGGALRLTPADRVLHSVPAAGTWGGINIPLTAWSHGACLVLMETWDPLRALSLIERERCTVWNAVDAMVKTMLEHPDLDRYDRSSLRTGGIAATGGGGHGLFEAVLKRIGMPLAFQPYGMTEVNAMALVHDLDEPPELRALPGIRAVPGLEARVVDPETGAPCPAGREGELQFRGPLVTPGYYKKPEETAAAFTADGWFRSGDLAVQDADGHIVFKGRLREVLRISHFMVAPGEIEALLMAHPGVEQAFVVGVPDPKTNEAAVAYVIRKPGAGVGEEELQAFCRGRVASYKIPRAVRFVSDVPRTPGPHGDKVQRVKLREQALAELAHLKQKAGGTP